MTDVLLGYIAIAFTVYAAVECWRANRYRQHTEESWREANELAEDQIEARLIGLERELLRHTRPGGVRLHESEQQVVAGREAQDDGGDEDQARDSLAHDLMVVAAQEGIALR